MGSKRDLQLETDVGTAICIWARDFRVHYSTASSHELQTASADRAFIPGEILMVDGAIQNVGNRLYKHNTKYFSTSLLHILLNLKLIRARNRKD